MYRAAKIQITGSFSTKIIKATLQQRNIFKVLNERKQTINQ